MTAEIPAAVRALAEQRAAARAAKDFAESDRLRDEIADAGWVVRDGAQGYELAERPPYAVLPSVADLPDRSADPDAGRCTVGVLVEGWPDDVVTCVEALVEHAPPDVRVVLLAHPDVTAAAVVGRPDPKVGEEVVAFVSLAAGSTTTPDELVAHCRQHVSAAKYPREVRVVDAVPLTSVLKTDRKALRAQLSRPGAPEPGSG